MELNVKKTHLYVLIHFGAMTFTVGYTVCCADHEKTANHKTKKTKLTRNENYLKEKF